jgi:hypothetical protein
MKGTSNLKNHSALSILLLAVCLCCCWGARTVKAAETAQFEQPLLITSAGQSAEVQLAAVLAKRAKLEYSLSKLATSQELQEAKTLVLSLGASLKGLGAAGLDVAQEKGRVEELLAAARKHEIPVICMHLGGESRRGQLSDDFISSFLPHAKVAIVVKSGNKDGFFSTLCEQSKISLIEVERAADALQPLTEFFSPEK